MFDKELLKGILPVIILKLLKNNGKMYGYSIMQTVRELSDNVIVIKDGSMYPILHKLKENGFVKTETENIGKRVRHYYCLTDTGKLEHKRREVELRTFIQTILKVIS
jgi:DNA-binding PadR family transcriptional regulator